MNHMTNDLHQLDRMIDGYTECAIWSSLDMREPLDTLAECFDAWATADDLSPETIAAFRRDCTDFYAEHYGDQTAELWTPEQFGHDFWLTRNGHGAGFWDRGHGPIGQSLSDAARVYGTVDLYTGDDGRIYS